eukprot:31519-Pelagococcus_subviridis.AAC.8
MSRCDAIDDLRFSRGRDDPLASAARLANYHRVTRVKASAMSHRALSSAYTNALFGERPAALFGRVLNRRSSNRTFTRVVPSTRL